MTKRSQPESPKQESPAAKRFRSGDFQVGSRVQVLWEMHDPETGECDLVYFSATVKDERPSSESGDIYVLAYDEVQGYTEAVEAEVRLVDKDSIFSIKDDSTQKWRKEQPKKRAIEEIKDRDAFCPLGHVLSRDLANESIRICDCCLSCYFSNNGQWECKAESTCQDWGVCDNCLDDYLKTGAWHFCEEVEKEEENFTINEIIEDLEDLAASDAEESLRELNKLPFVAQSNIAHGIREFIELVTAGMHDLIKDKTPDYVITAQDIHNITSKLRDHGKSHQ